MTFVNVENLISKLTLEEKISLLSATDSWHTTSIPRLGIPAIRVSDGPNGIRGTKHFGAVGSACFPNGTALASTFDLNLLIDVGNTMSREAIAKNASVILGPTINIQRGPLGGRGYESFSEDPYLAGMMAASIVKGIQSDGLAATIKHFVCNDLEHQRLGSNSIVTERALREIYLEPFRLAIKYSEPVCLMTAYNKVNGEHASQNTHLLYKILKDEWKYKGLIMSDWHGTYSSAAAIKNGLDIEFPGPTKWRSLGLIKHLITSRECLTEEDINARVNQVLNLVKYIVENNSKNGIIEGGKESTSNNTPETATFLRKLAAETIVLLKNESNLLPLDPKDSVVVIGPNAKTTYASGGGSASLKAYYVVSTYQGIKNKVKRDLDYTMGAESHKTLAGLVEDLLLDPSKSKIGNNIGMKAIFYKDQPSKRNSDTVPFDSYILDRSFVRFTDYIHKMVDRSNPVFYVDFEGYLKPEYDGDYIFGMQVFGTAILYLDDEIVIDNTKNQVRGSFAYDSGTVEMRAMKYLKKGTTYKVKVEFGSGPTSELKNIDGVGAIQLGYVKYFDPENEIKHAVSLAKQHHNVILCVGLNAEWESEGHDRSNMLLPGKVNELIEKVVRANPRTVVVNQSGMPVEVPWIDHANAFLQCWYGGNELGNAIADVIFGDVVPSGKLPISWPLRLQDNPSYFNFRTEGGRVLYGEDIYVGYKFYEKVEKEVAFPFGYGLSYTNFDLRNLNLAITSDLIEISVNISNIGDKFSGAEVVQVYIAAKNSSIGRPKKELKGFTKVFLQPGETKKAKIDIVLKDSISYFDEYRNKWCAEAGFYTILVGVSSNKILLTQDFEKKGTEFWTGL